MGGSPEPIVISAPGGALSGLFTAELATEKLQMPMLVSCNPIVNADSLSGVFSCGTTLPHHHPKSPVGHLDHAANHDVCPIVICCDFEQCQGSRPKALEVAVLIQTP